MEYLKVWVDFREVLEPLDDSEKGRLFVAMLDYAAGEEQIKLSGNERFLWAVAKQQIDRMRAENERLKVNGSKGGRPKKQEEQKKPTESKPVEQKPKETRFTPPTLEEVKAYFKEKGAEDESERFMDFYASKGWKVGDQKMKDWKASVRNWIRGSSQRSSTPAKTVVAQQYGQRDYSNEQESIDEMMERLMRE